MTIGIHQPYFFPYLGYFQLINAVDQFIIYDDVNFIKQGYINRNAILLEGQAQKINLLVKDISSNKKINEHFIVTDRKWKKKLIKNIQQNYSKAPFYKERIQFIESLILIEEDHLANYLTTQIKNICAYIGINTIVKQSSKTYPNTTLLREQRIVAICNQEKASKYINAIGGEELYNKNEFKQLGLNLYFLKTSKHHCQQHNNTFVPDLSIIDVLMFNSIDEIKDNLLNKYTLC